MKKAIAILLSMALLLTLIPTFGAATVSAASGTMYVGTSKYVTISAGGYVEYYFTPTSSGSYTFYSTGSYDTYGYIKNSSGTTLASDDDSGTDYNFSVTYSMTANTTYILRSKFYSSSQSGYFYQYITYNHTHTYTSNCDTICNVCSATRTTNYTHVYTDSCDASCNVCATTRTAPHTYSGNCDTTCNNCSATRTTSYSHTYTSSADASCNVCGYTRVLMGILEDVTESVTISTGGQNVDFVFSPGVSDYYTFYSSGSYDTYGYILDEDGYQLYSDDDDGDDRNFSITVYLAAGETYILRSSMYSSSQTGSFTITVYNSHEYDYDCQTICNYCDYVREAEDDHYYWYDCSATCADCGEVNPNATHYYEYSCSPECEYCGNKRSGVTHSFDDDDDCYCNVCGSYCFELIDPPASEVYTNSGSTAKVALKVRSEYASWCTYQWYIKDAGASKFSASSITSNTYSVKMSDKVAGRQIYCVITDWWTGKTIQTDVVTLRVNFSLTEGSQVVYAQSGKTAKVVLNASGEGLTYTWYVKNAGASKYTKSSVTSSTYSVKMSSSSKGRRVLCIVEDKYGNSIQSQSYLIRESVSITSQPSATTQTIKTGNTAKIAIKASGDGLTYAWYIKNSGSSKYSKSSTTSATYSVKMTAAVSGRQVYCVVKDKYGKTVQSKTYLLQSDFAITTQPQTSSTKLGDKAKVTVKAIGSGLKYTWYVKNPGASGFTKSSTTSATYTVKMTAAVHGRQVYCVVKDAKGNTIKSATATLHCKAAITTQPKNVTAANGKTAKVTLKAVGEGLTYTWYVKDSGKSSYTKSSNTTATYSVKMSGKANGRLVYCVVKDKYGNTVQSSTVILMMG